MFKSVLIAEDHECANISLRKTLEHIGIVQFDPVYYCDDALMKIQKGIRTGQPYDLLITDLSFEEDQHKQKISGGIALITAARQIQPNLNVLVFSLESRPVIIDGLFKDLLINGYVRKARRDGEELKVAIESIYKGRLHFPSQLRQAIKQKNTYNFTDLDIIIISQLSNGIHQKHIPIYLNKNQIRPSGLSSVEKRLNLMKEALNFSKNEQLIAYCKDMGII